MDTTILLYAVLGIIVLGLIILGVGVALLISGMKEPMKEIKGKVNSLKERTDKLTLEATALMHTTNELKEDIQSKSEHVNNVIDAAKGTKNSVIDLNSTVRRITGGIATKVDHDKNSVAQVDQWSNAAVTLLNKVENRKKSITSETNSYPEEATNDKITVRTIN